ncbi:MAG: M3 family oligoendopeptidase [Spirochaetes bacterium]|nr:M3 family oligoendopeptidase [Spirochaetota bacterium]
MGKIKIEHDMPLWNLFTVYKGLDDPLYIEDKEKMLMEFQQLLDFAAKNNPAGADEEWVEAVIRKIEQAEVIYDNLYSYCYANYSTQTADAAIVRELNSLENERLKLLKAKTIFRKKISFSQQQMEKIAKENSFLSNYTLFLNEAMVLKKHQLSRDMEAIVEELLQPGANSWSRLQEAISSDLSVKWNKKKREKKTVTQLRALAFSKSRKTRKRAFEKEIKAWKSAEIPLAYALNGIKGTGIILNRRRKWKSAIEKSVFQSRMNEDVLRVLISAMEKSLPVFHKYLDAKASLLGVKKLAFYDLFAPLPLATKAFSARAATTNAAPGDAVPAREKKTKLENDICVWPFQDAANFITEAFRDFSPEMGLFVENAFNKRWIDAAPHKGKVGGAYCINFPLAKESRILCNYNNSFSAVATVAHELGHAWHNEVLKDESIIHHNYPMTLAETASIFSEIMIFDKAINGASCSAEKLFIMEILLQEVTQIIVDILSRFYFEKEVFARREKGDISAQEFSAIMRDAQKKTYGNAIAKKTYHQYMWAVKGHYYIPSLSFYNYPYAFGQLFGVALYKKYLSDKENFPQQYNKILRESGRKTSIEIAQQAGFDIEKELFWLDSIDYIKQMIDEFSKIAFTGESRK